jgi:hypothetical protein
MANLFDFQHVTMKKRIYFIGFTVCSFLAMKGQNYHAIQGSYYAGGLGVHNNPSSIVNTPYKWDLTLFGTQLKSSNNFIRIEKYSLLSNPANSEYFFRNGNYAREAKLNLNLNLLNACFAINRKSALAFGINFRSHTSVKTSPYNFIDTLNRVADFFKINTPTATYEGDMLSSSWLEVYGSYGRTVLDNEKGRLNAGITIKAGYSVAGAFVRFRNGQYQRINNSGETDYFIKSAAVNYGYSSNFDRWEGQQTIQKNINTLIGASQSGASIDLGLEYLVKTQEITSVDDDESYNDYKWKIGLAVLDMGFQRYSFGVRSRAISAVFPNVASDSLLDIKFSGSVNSLERLNDTLATLGTLGGNGTRQFNVLNPVRMVLNVDRYITGNFFINAELSFNLGSLAPKQYYTTEELNLLTVVPRWETRKYGVYLPLSYNTRQQFWVGGAFKAGPLLFGVHNLANIFSTKKIQNGGGYIAITFRSPQGGSDRKDNRLNCPKPVW